MNEIPIQHCPQCGAALPAGPGTVCPRCAAGFLQGSATDATAAGQAKHPFTQPEAAELASKFPQLEIVTFIGKGGMGAVYKARQRQLDRVVALKILPPGIGDDPAFAERFAREAKAMARLNHPGIVTIHDFGRADGLFYFLMEFVDGVSLAQLMLAGRLSPREALAIVPQICDALQYAHDQGLVHRDIKPENILLDRLGRVKVADFGLVKLMERSGEPTAPEGVAGSPILTQAGKVLGTPRYMAPEQLEHPTEVDHRADIYALGVVFYQMLTGQLPGKPLEAPSKKVRLDVRLDEVVLRALEQAPERRYQQASQVKTAVETVAGAPDQTGKGAKIPEPPPQQGDLNQPKHKAMLKTLLLAVGVLLGIGVLVFVAAWGLYLRQHRPPPPDTPLSVLAYPVTKGDVKDHINFVASAVSSNSLVFSLPQDSVQDFVRKVSAGQKLPLTGYDRDGAEFGRGFVTALDNQMDPQTGTLKCTASLQPEQGQVMLPGMFLMVRVLGDIKHGVIRVPAEALERIQQSTFVWVITPENTVTRKAVVVGIVEDPWAQKMEVVQRLLAQRVGAGETNGTVIPEQWAEIYSGVAPGELVVVRPPDVSLQRSSRYRWKVLYELVKVVASPELSAPTGAPGQNR